MGFKPRPAQQRVLAYRGGKLGVSAVPGSGKTHTLSYLAAQLIAGGQLHGDQEVLIVTLVNAAANNFKQRVRAFLDERGLLPHVGYRVCTLHSLAHDIVRQRPGLVGLSDGFVIVDERAAELILDDVVRSWVRSHPHACDPFLSASLEGNKREWVRRERWPDLVKRVAKNFIKRAKDLCLTPEDVAAHLGASAAELPLVMLGYAVYDDYRRALAYRGALDFDDLIRLAHKALMGDPDFLERLQQRWPFVLEDEAQDSSQLQEAILRLLAGPRPNWVRVGDPNQAIYETFTTADPQLLRDFLREQGVTALTLPNSGRSTQSVIALANHLIDWTHKDHPHEGVRGALTPPHIEPTPPGDPQPNPPDGLSNVRLVEKSYSPEGEVKAIAQSLERWLPKHARATVAVLAPRNKRGEHLCEALDKRHIEHVELLQSTVSTRHTAGALCNLLNALADPKSPRKLATAFCVWRRADRDQEQDHARLKRGTKLLRACRQVETYLWPQLGDDWLEALEVEDDLRAQLKAFRALVRRLQAAALLPVDQLLLTLAADVFFEPAELALSYKLALLLRRAAIANPDWRLPELSQELRVVATNERKFLGVGDDETGFDPEKYRGTVVVTTLHRAKGLEWDRVYLMSLNSYDFPSALPYDRYLSEKWWVRDELNLEAEVLSQLQALCDGTEVEEEGKAGERARVDYAAERLRLLYVGITRAKKELIATWNTGRGGHDKKTPALPFVALQTFWEDHEAAA